MKKTVVIVGNSQLSFFVAKQLAKEIGDLVHMETIWITTTDKIFPSLHRPIELRLVGGGVEVIKTAIKSINLNDQRIITGKKTIHYDLLFIDQAPVFGSADREKILDQFETLVATIHSQENRGVSSKAKVFVAGKTAESYQLALDLAERKNRDSSAAASAVRVEIDPIAEPKFSSFMKERGVSTSKSQHPGFQVKSPIAIFPSKKIRGLRVDLSGRAMLLATGEPTQHQNVVIIDDVERDLQNIARADWQLAKRIVANLLTKLEGGLEKPLDQRGRKLILHSPSGSYLELGNTVSVRARAKAVIALEKRFWRSF